jgi:hypothetical protein
MVTANSTSPITKFDRKLEALTHYLCARQPGRMHYPRLHRTSCHGNAVARWILTMCNSHVCMSESHGVSCTRRWGWP